MLGRTRKTFAIIGLSTFGQYLATYLAERKFDVIVIDENEARVERVKSIVSKGIIADATDKSTLEKLGIDEADAVIVCLGESIDASLLVVLYLKEIGVGNIYVKVLTEEHARILKLIGVTNIIFPERDSAFTMAQTIDNTNVLDFIPLVEGHSIIDMTPPESFIGKTLGELDLRNKYGVQVIVIKEIAEATVIAIPRADHVVKTSDILFVLGSNDDLEALKQVV